MTNNNIFKVCIRCDTFNHKGYIQDAMEGFAMQKTDFPFVAVIMDDCSTDGTQEVIKEFLAKYFILDDPTTTRQEETEDYSMTYARHKENANCFFAVYLLKYNHYSIKKSKEEYIREWTSTPPYISLCEGDDFWTQPDKLQTQVDFLDSHADYTMCFHDVDIKAEPGRDWYNVFGTLVDRDYTGLENLITWSVPTCSMVMRRECFDSRPQNPHFTMGDNVLVLKCHEMGRVRCIPRKMGVYRLTPTSWIGGQSDKVQRYKYISHYKGLIEEFEECRCQEMYAILESQYFQLLTILKREGDKEEFEKIKTEYLEYPGVNHFDQFSSYYLKSQIRHFMKSLLGKGVVSWVRKLKG